MAHVRDKHGPRSGQTWPTFGTNVAHVRDKRGPRSGQTWPTFGANMAHVRGKRGPRSGQTWPTFGTNVAHVRDKHAPCLTESSVYLWAWGSWGGRQFCRLADKLQTIKGLLENLGGGGAKRIASLNLLHREIDERQYRHPVAECNVDCSDLQPRLSAREVDDA